VKTRRIGLLPISLALITYVALNGGLGVGPYGAGTIALLVMAVTALILHKR
jgi:hypothetical protein